MSIKENTFAAACFDDNTAEELERAIQGSADKEDMKVWGISQDEWYEQIKLALEEKRSG